MPEPGNPQALNRYSYVRNNPLRYNDPTGHDWHRVLPHPDGWPVLPRPDGWPVPPAPPHDEPVSAEKVVRWLLYDEMLPHAQSDVVKEIRWRVWASNISLVGCLLGIYGVGACGAGALERKTPYAQWRALVDNNALWDHKEEITEKYGDGYSAYRKGYRYRFDIWSNIHYGYVGRAAGFTPLELLAGAGWAHIRANGLKPELWRTFFDDPYDQAAIKLGMALYDEYRLNVDMKKFWQVFDEYAPMLPRIKMEDGGSGGE